MTSGEVRDLLGWSHSTWKRARKDGRIPFPGAVSESGWALWTAEQVRALVAKQIERVT